MPNTFGHNFRVTTFGESHGGAVGCVIDGCPPGLEIDRKAVQTWLDRRRPGQSHLASPRKEGDKVEWLSGLEENKTLGTPILMMVHNKDANPKHYEDIRKVFRPSHADYTTFKKSGIKPLSGGGRASARETIGRVAAAGVAEQWLHTQSPDLAVVACVESVKGRYANIDFEMVTRDQVEEHPLRCPDQSQRQELEKIIIAAQQDKDTVGGTVACVIRGLRPGLGEPVFDKLEADLAKAMMSLPASKGFEVGSGFAGTEMFGSEHNDPFVLRDGQIRTSKNDSGGIQGGISNGENIFFRVAFKPVSTLFREQQTVDVTGKPVTFKPKFGRHDPCVLPRAVPMVEAMATLVVADHWLRASY